MAISKIVPQSTGFGDANVGLQIPNISLENRAAEAANGTIFFNTSNNAIEVYANGAWTGIGSSAVTPVISAITGTIDSGNYNSQITISGTNFDVSNELSAGSLRFTYSGVTTTVTVTPNTSTSILNVTIPSAVLNNSPSTTGTVQFLRSDGELSNAFEKNMTADEFVSVDYLVLAGGAGGGGTINQNDGAGGGGAGGFITGNIPLVAGTPYTVTIGAGGSGTSGGPVAQGSNGSSSVFSSFTAIGGGGGGSENDPAFSGGSGGGGGGGGDAGTGGLGTPGQGNAGGSSADLRPTWGLGGAGGGGYGSVGGTFSSGPLAGAGGTGISNSITGTPLFYAAGGGGGGGIGGTPSPGTNVQGAPGGSGIGGNGGNIGSPGGSAPTVNRGSGGGGAGCTNLSGPNKTGGNGSAGVVILKYNTNVSLTNPGGGLTISNSTSIPGHNVATISAGTGTITFI